jgi:hypothetical protein
MKLAIIIANWVLWLMGAAGLLCSALVAHNRSRDEV